jgi:signal transduction histidine kinase/HAMP domain-containing protein
MLALVLAGLLTFVLTRRILRPLSAAAAVADQIAQGHLNVVIPAGRHDEIGRLLRSMRSMQTSIRAMMDLEAEQRRSAQRRLVDAIEGAQEGMMLVGADGEIIITNTQMRHFLPLAGDCLKPGIAFDSLITQAVPIGMASTAEGVSDDPVKLLATEGEVRLGDELWLKISRGSTGDGGFFLFWSDISVIKERELRLREAKSEAEAASRSKSAFLANMSHELRTPLNAIIGFSEIMVSEMYGGIGDSRYKEYATLIAGSGRHLLDVISTILDFAKSEAGQMVLYSELLDLREVVEPCVSMVGHQCARSDLTLRWDAPAEPVMVMGEASKLKQILLNLLSNAIKFTPAGGEVCVKLTVDVQGARLLAVSDSGIGMKSEDIPVALAPFGQVDSGLSRSYQGTGLGLPLAKAFAELHGASFEVVSRLDEGTTVSLRFPSPNMNPKGAIAPHRPEVDAAA